MGELLNLEFNLFVLIAVGFLLKRIALVGREGEKNLTDLVIDVVLPCNIITSFMTTLSREMVVDCLWILGISIGIQLLALAYGRWVFRGQPHDRYCSLTYGIICSNAGFLGNPVAEGVFGPVGLMLASIYLIPQRIMMWSRGLAIYTGGSDRRDVVRRVLTHPCVVACAIGVAIMAAGGKLPPIIKAPISTLGRCNTALSMLVIGLILGDIDLRTLVDKTVIAYTVHRLVVFPMIIYGVCLLLPVSPLVRGVSVLLAAMPAGAVTSMLAAKYDCEPAFATRLVIFSTLCSIPAIMVWSAILK